MTLLADAATGTGLADLFTHPFIRHALLAGLPIAALAGLAGYFVVLRSQLFTGDALSHVAFTGAVGALALGFDARVGLFAATIAGGALLGALGQRGRADDVVIGTVFAWILGLGVLALSVFSSSGRGAVDAAAGARVLFGSVFGLSGGQAGFAAAVAAVLIVGTLVIARPLLFASLDPGVAAARGVPVGWLGIGFLGLVGAASAEASQAVGALLLLGLLAAPAGAALRLTSRPFVGMALSSALATASLAGGVVTSFLLPRIPPSFAIVGLASLVYALSALTSLRGRGPRAVHRSHQ